MTTESSKKPVPANDLERRLGFKIEIAEGREAGSVIWFGKDGVRPATGVEIALWTEVVRHEALRAPSGVPAESVIDPFGTPKEGGSSAE